MTYFSQRVLLLSTLVAISGAACNAEVGEHAIDEMQRGVVNLVAVAEDGQLLVQVQNHSKETVQVADEPLVGFDLIGPRVGLTLRNESAVIIPCAHVDPSQLQNPGSVLPPDETIKKSVSIRLLAKVYCLKTGRYFVRAVYPSGADKQIVSNEIAIEISEER